MREEFGEECRGGEGMVEDMVEESGGAWSGLEVAHH